MTLSIVDFLNARLAEDEATARAAIDPDRPGVNWEWIDPDDDTAAEFEDGSLIVGSLRTVEDFPTRSVGDLPAFVIHTAEDVMEGAAVHIASHDPARVLREVTAKRALLNVYEIAEETHDILGDGFIALDQAIRAMAAVYSDHESYREEWAAL